MGFTIGQKCEYKGCDAVVVNTYFWSNTITILVNGERIRVNKNDLFNMNSEERLAKYDKEIQHYQNVIEENKDIWSCSKEQIAQYKIQMNSILSANGVSSVSDLTDTDAIKQFNFLNNQKNSARLAQIRAGSEITTAANNTATSVFYKINAINQQAINQQIT